MLHPATPFPHVGSYALLVDPDAQAPQAADVVVGFPLRAGAGGTKRVAADQLIDATPLTSDETRAFHQLDRALAGTSGRTAKQRAQRAMRDALKQRLIYAPLLDRLLRAAAATKARAA
jgi:hypothetical protein